MKADTSDRPGVGNLVWQQLRYHNKLFWRTPIAAFFTLVFPLMLLFLLVALFGNEEIEGLGLTTAQFSAPGLGVFAAVSAAYTGLAISTATARDRGLLKRVRGTPLPSWAYITGRLASTVYQAAIAVVLMMAVGVVLFEVTIVPRMAPAALVTFVLGVGCFAALGMLVAAISPSGDAAPAITNATLLPLAFISDIFFPMREPTWLEVTARVFPLRHFAVPFRDSFDSAQTGFGFNWLSLGVMLAWGLVAFLVAQRRFRWEPRGG